MYKIPNPPKTICRCWDAGIPWVSSPRAELPRHWNFGCWHERQDSMDDLISRSFHRTFVLGSRLCAVSHGNLGAHTRTEPGLLKWKKQPKRLQNNWEKLLEIYLFLSALVDMIWYVVEWKETNMNVGMNDWMDGWMDGWIAADSIDACMDGHDHDHGI